MSVEREKGAVAASCPVHPGVDLEAQRQLDGAISYSACPECESDREEAAQSEGREKGSHVGDDPLDIPEVQAVVIDDPDADNDNTDVDTDVDSTDDTYTYTNEKE